jgi:hypothetical protein
VLVLFEVVFNFVVRIVVKMWKWLVLVFCLAGWFYVGI